MSKFDLSPKQIETLKTELIRNKVDNMATKDLVDYVISDLHYYYYKLTDNEFLTEAEDYWEEHFPDIIKDVKDVFI